MSVLPYLTTVPLVVTTACLVSSKYPLIFLTLSIGVPDILDNGKMLLSNMFSVLDILHPVNSRISA